MKKIYYLLALLAVAVGFSSCNPLDKTYKDLGNVPVPTPPVAPAPTIASITLASTDYVLLPANNPAQTNLFFSSSDAANASIPTILNSKYPTAVDKSQITVTYPLTPTTQPYFKPADSLYTHLTYTLVNNADYLRLPGNTFADFSAAQILQWLSIMYPTPTANQLAIITFIYYDGATSTVTQGFIYLNGAWKKAYLISPAQYASVGRGTANDFVTADNNLASLAAYFNQFLKADPTIATTAKVSDVQYVTYKYNTFQRVLPLSFDGVNWDYSTIIQNAVFTKTGGVWNYTADNTFPYTLKVPDDYTTIGNLTTTGAAANAIANLKAHGNFAIASTTDTRWADAQIAAGIATILKTSFSTVATPNQKFKVTFSTYGGYATEIETFQFDGTNFNYLPTPDNGKYTFTGDDYTAISTTITTGASSAAMTNLDTFGDFSLSGSTAWTDAQINAGLAAVLKTRYPAATLNQTIATTYAVYSGGNTTAQKTFKFDGTNFVIAP